MKLKNEKYRQIILLGLIICGTLIFYTSQLVQNRNQYNNELLKDHEIRENINQDKRAENYFSTFIENPESEEGINGLYDLIVYWDNSGSYTLIQSVVKVFDLHTKSELLKNKFYVRLGKYYLNVKRKTKASVNHIDMSTFSRLTEIKNYFRLKTG